jgi:ABC-2 type transport system permease protein
LAAASASSGVALATGVVVGTLLAVFLASLGFLISVFASSNRVSLSLSLLLLLALFVPTQLPSAAQQGWAGDLLLRLNPITASEHYVGKIVTSAHPWSEDLSWLVSPLVCAAAFAALALLAGARFVRLGGGATA